MCTFFLIVICTLINESTLQDEPIATDNFIVNRIFFYGNTAFKAKALKKIMRTKEGSVYDEYTLTTDKERIVLFYKNHGFREAEIIESKKEVDLESRIINCYLTIDEGVQTKVSAIKFTGNQIVSAEEFTKIVGIKPGDPLIERKILIAKINMTALYASKGYIYAEVRSTIMDVEKDAIEIEFKISEGKPIIVGNISIGGNDKTRNKIISREITLKEGTVYDPQRILESQARIYGTDLFKAVRFELHGVAEKKDTIDVVFIVEEREPRWLGFGTGFSTPSRIRINGAWGHDNLWNIGQKIEVRATYTFNFQGDHREELDAVYHEPYFFDTPFKLELRPFYNRAKGMPLPRKEVSWGGEARIGRYIGRNFQAFVRYKFKRYGASALDDSQDEFQVKPITNSILFSLFFDRRDNIFSPTKGYLLLSSYEYAGGVFGGDNTFRKFSLDFSGFKEAWASVLAARLKLGHITGGEAPPPDRFLLGGVNSIRGYDEEKPIGLEYDGGNIMCLLNLEVRLPLIARLEISYFLDMGGVWLNSSELSMRDLKAGVGFGLRYSTPIGPIRLDYGRKITDVEKQDIGEIYLAIGHMF